MKTECPFDDAIFDLLERKPFVPFVITLKDGENIEIAGQHQLAITKGSKIMAVLLSRPKGAMIRKSEITAIKSLEPAN